MSKEQVLTLTDDFEGVTLRRSQTGRLIIDVSALGDTDITVHGAQTDVKLQEPSIEQNRADLFAVDKRVLQIGDVLGVTFDLPEGLERLHRWLIYNITDEGIPQALEPKDSAPEGLMRWPIAVKHVQETLYVEGHENARIWTDADADAIVENVVNRGFNDKAQLALHGFTPEGGYWNSSECDYFPRCHVVSYPGAGRRFWAGSNGPGPGARIRAVQDVPELAI